MKKLIGLFFTIYIFSYANYLITNSEIVLFYDKETKSIEYVKGDIFNKIDISNIEFSLILNKREIIPLKRYFVKGEFLSQNNIFRLVYKLEEKEIFIDILPSIYERDKLYILVKFINFPSNQEKIDFVFKISPQYDNKYLIHEGEDSIYSYDNIYFKSENYLGEVYIGRDEELESLNLEEVKEKSKKYEGENFYYIVKDIQYSKPINFIIKFYQNFQKEEKNRREDILARELDYWNQVGIENNYKDKKEIFVKELNNLEIITSRLIIPNKIGYDKSKEDLDIKAKLYYLNTIYNKNFNPNKLLEDINIRKSETQALIYYTLLFKYLNNSERYIGGNIVEGKIIPEVLSLLDYLEEIDDEVINVRNNIENYYWYYELITAVENREAFKEYKEFIQEKKEFLLKYLNSNFVLEDGLKTRKESRASYYKNIKYLGFLPKDKQLEILNRDYERYYNKYYGVLKKENKEKRIDIDYNLNFVIKLYEVGEKRKAELLFSNIKRYIEKNNYYIIKYMYPDRKNILEIDGEMLYLYFMAEESRKKYGD